MSQIRHQGLHIFISELRKRGHLALAVTDDLFDIVVRQAIVYIYKRGNRRRLSAAIVAMAQAAIRFKDSATTYLRRAYSLTARRPR